MSVLAIALILRLSAAFTLSPPLISDDQDYEAIARNILTEHSYTLDGAPTAYRPPGYPLFLASVYWLFGTSFLAVRVVQAILDTLACALVFGIGRRITSGRNALLASGIYALFPLQILYVTSLMTETAFTLVLLISFRLLLSLRSSLFYWTLTGMVIGIAVLVRTTAIALPLLVLVSPVYRQAQLRVRLHIAAAILSGVMLVLVPWVVRNEETLGRATLTTNGGVNFWIGNHPGANGSFHFPPGNELDLIKDEFERSDRGLRRGLEFWMTSPIQAVVVTGKKFAHFFEIDYWMVMLQHYRPEWRSTTSAADVFRELPGLSILATHLPFVAVLSGTLMLFFGVPRGVRNQWAPVIALCAGWLFIHLVFFATARYRFPLHPFLVLAAVEGIALFRSRSLEFTGARRAGFAITALLLLAGWSAETWILLGGSVHALP